MNFQEENHDLQVQTLEQKLKNKNRYDSVRTEVPIYENNVLKVQADVLTIDKKNKRMIYWEVKTGSHKHCYKRFKKQAKEFLYQTKNADIQNRWSVYAVYYNPTAKKIGWINSHGLEEKI